ncbi:MAG: DMT family transporter [Chloroflexi bacterium]|nr:DMT family transporter [Chloroflexota bacterium]
MKPAFLVLMILMNLLWAVSYPAFKVLASHLTSGNIVTLRFGLAAMILAFVWPWLPGNAPRQSDLTKAAVMGLVVFCAAPRMQVYAVHRGQAGDASVLMALDPLITSLAAAFFLGERITRRRWCGFGLGMAGVVLLARVWRRDFEPLHGLMANLLFISSFVGETAYSVMGKPLLQRSSPAKLLGTALLIGTMVNACLDGPATLAAARHLPFGKWMLILYLVVVCTIAGYALWYVVIRETEVSLTALTVLIQPLAGLAISVLALRESLHWGQLWGALAIICGLAVGLRPNQVDASTDCR